MRINSFLARCGLGSRRKVEELILKKQVFVNGSNIISLSTQIDPQKDEVICNNKKLTLIEDKVYLMLNKPKLVLSTVSDDRGRKTVMDYVDKTINIFPVGRLDYNTEGLILLTNDGEFANNVIHPSKMIWKTYEAKLNKTPKPIDLVKLRKGVDIGDVIKTSPAQVSNPELCDDGLYKVVIKISEGRNRQIRRMFKAVGYNVLELKRIAIGNLLLGNLKSGKIKTLTDNDIKNIFN